MAYNYLFLYDVFKVHGALSDSFFIAYVRKHALTLGEQSFL